MRRIASITGLGKDSVHRALKALKKRNQYPSIRFLDNGRRSSLVAPDGFGHRLWIGYQKSSWCREIINIFLSAQNRTTGRRERQVQYHEWLTRVEEQLVNYQQSPENQLGSEKLPEIVASGDETFFNDKLILVLMELSSGYLVVKGESQDRSYDSWFSMAENRLKQKGTESAALCSFRGKSLVKACIRRIQLLCRSWSVSCPLFHQQMVRTIFLSTSWESQ